MLAAAGVVFFAFWGFDAVSTAAPKNPKRNAPIGILGSLAIYFAYGRSRAKIRGSGKLFSWNRSGHLARASSAAARISWLLSRQTWAQRSSIAFCASTMCCSPGRRTSAAE